MAFAIPIDLAKGVEAQLLAHGHVVRGRLGVNVQDVDQGLARAFGLQRPHGALVDSVAPDSPAASGGLRSGDVIMQVNGKPIDDSAGLAATIADIQPGTHVALEFVRGRVPQRVSVTVSVAPTRQTDSSQAGEPGGAGSVENRLGLTVRPLSEDERSAAGVSGGLMVKQVQGAAAQAGIDPGDIILAFDATRVSSLAQLRALLDHAGKQTALLVERNGTSIFVPVELG